MNDKTKTTTNGTATAGSLYRVNYQYIANNGQLRAGAIVIEAKDASEAFEIANAKLPSFGLRFPKITNAKPY